MNTYFKINYEYEDGCSFYPTKALVKASCEEDAKKILTEFINKQSSEHVITRFIDIEKYDYPVFGKEDMLREVKLSQPVSNNTNNKYVVICYSVHNREIASYDIFDNEDTAYEFLEQDAQNTYEEEVNNSGNTEDSMGFTMDKGKAFVYSCDGDCIWTWEVVPIPID